MFGAVADSASINKDGTTARATREFMWGFPYFRDDTCRAVPNTQRGGAYAVPSKPTSHESNDDLPVERRQNARGDSDPLDWETKVLMRLERHIESLSGNQRSLANPPSELGWEEASVRVLQNRVRDLQSEQL